MECPTPCVCGRIVELDEMCRVYSVLPDGGNLVCEDCICPQCEGECECDLCSGCGACHHCDQQCPDCQGSGKCFNCGGTGYVVSEEDAE